MYVSVAAVGAMIAGASVHITLLPRTPPVPPVAVAHFVSVPAPENVVAPVNVKKLFDAVTVSNPVPVNVIDNSPFAPALQTVKVGNVPVHAPFVVTPVTVGTNNKQERTKERKQHQQ